MTTIVWDGKTLAADGRGTCGSLIVEDDAKKIVKLKGEYSGEKALAIALAGVVGFEDEIIYGILSGDQFIIPQPAEFSGILVTDISVYTIHSKLVNEEDPSKGTHIPGDLYRDPGNICIGSGMVAAYSALKFGKDAVEAVKHAINMDIYSGGKITKMRLR